MGLLSKAVAALQFSQGEIVVYCACSTKHVVQNLEDADFKNLEAGNDLRASFRAEEEGALRLCAKIWEAKQRH
jgi:hypothetical protein